GCGSGWVAGDRAARQVALDRDATRALEDARSFCRRDKLAEALEAVKRAEALLAGGGGGEALRQHVRQLRADVEMAARLEAIRLDRSAVRGGHFDTAGAEPRYRDAFQDYGRAGSPSTRTGRRSASP